VAAVLRFTDQSSPADTYDLLSGTLRLVEQSWRTRTPAVVGSYRHVPYGAQPQFSHFGVVVEQMDLIGEDSASGLITAVNKIEDFLERARLNRMMLQRSNNIWLEGNVDGENIRRALVYEGSLVYPTSVGISPLMPRQVLRAKLSVSRHPFWENAAATSATQNNVSCLGGTWYSSSGTGRAPGRIGNFQINGRNGGGGPLYRFWVGIREYLWGYSGFVPVWEAEDGTNNNPATDTSDQASAAASGGYYVQCGFTTTTAMTKRFTIRGRDVSAGWGMRGRYLVVARLRVGTGTTCAVQIKTGLSGGNALDPREIVYVDDAVFGTNWHMVELGEVDIPPVGTQFYGRPQGDLEAETTIEVWAERVSGNNGLGIDCLIMIPSRHIAFVEGGAVQYDGGPPATRKPVRIFTYADDTVDAMSYEYQSIADNTVGFSVRDFYLPHEGWLVVLAGERATQSVLGDAVDVAMDYYARWPSYRGS